MLYWVFPLTFRSLLKKYSQKTHYKAFMQEQTRPAWVGFKAAEEGRAKMMFYKAYYLFLTY